MNKTYGVSGLLEWSAVIKAGKAAINVMFSGGSLNGYGITPATYTTSNAIIQAIIENSAYFQSGKIKLLSTAPLVDPLKEVVTDLDTVGSVKPKKEVLEVYNCSDARIWLKEHKNISVVGKSKNEIKEIAAANGISFPNLFRE